MWKTRDKWAYLLIVDRSICSIRLGRYELIETIPKLSKLGFPSVILIKQILNVHPTVRRLQEDLHLKFEVCDLDFEGLYTINRGRNLLGSQNIVMLRLRYKKSTTDHVISFGSHLNVDHEFDSWQPPGTNSLYGMHDTSVPRSIECA